MADGQMSATPPAAANPLWPFPNGNIKSGQQPILKSQYLRHFPENAGIGCACKMLVKPASLGLAGT
jgi:hypothetical protein